MRRNPVLPHLRRRDMNMKYRKHEAKEYARNALKGVWTALPYCFTEDDRLDEAGNAANLEHCISQLKIEGHYCSATSRNSGR